MTEILEFFHYSLAIRGLIAASLVGIMCGLLGCFIVLRNMSLIGDALSHAILPGVVFAFMIFGYSTMGFFLGSVLAGMIAAVAITWIQHKVKTKNDAAIGIVFTAMFSIGVIGISWISRNNGVHLDLKDFLFGNILGVSDSDLILTAVITAYVILSIIIFYRYLFITTFQPTIAETMGISVKTIHYFLMLLLSFAVVASLQTVGVILVVAMLITPASTALLLSDKLKTVLLLSAIFGLASAVLGMLLAVALDTTPGPAMAIIATLLYLLAILLAPKKGMIAKWKNARELQKKIDTEDIIKRAYKLKKQSKLSKESLIKALDFSSTRFNNLSTNLQNAGLMKIKGNDIILSKTGMDKALELVRAHRLWESYLVSKIGLDQSQIHEDAERYEHLLTAELLDEVDESLGYPTHDPHGSPIPLKQAAATVALSQLDVLQNGKISSNQIVDEIVEELWAIGVLPHTVFNIVSISDEEIIIKTDDGKELKIDNKMADQINVEI